MKKANEKFDKTMNKFEKTGNSFGILLGKTIKNPFKLILIILSFIFVGLIVFFYAFKDGVKLAFKKA
jgi:hypothetical protein